MGLFRLAALSLSAALLVFGTPIIKAQTPNAGEPQTTAELARAIAFTLSSNPGAANSSSSFISLVSATSHGNIVEVKYVVKEQATFARLKQNASTWRVGITSYFCNQSRVKYINQGVIIHESLASAGGDDPLDITIDKSSCDALSKPTPADPATLAKLALSVVDAENEALRRENAGNSHFQFSGASAHQGLVEERFTIAANSLAAMQANRTNLRDVIRGYLCAGYRDPLLRGVAIHRFFVSEDGSPVFDFTIDGSNC